MPLRFVLRQRNSSVPLEVEGITSDLVRGKSLAEIEKLEVFEGNVKSRLADFFAVSGDARDEIHEWEGDLSGVHWIGAKMQSGKIIVSGNGGRHIGSEMRGGGIRHGAGMKRGTIVFLSKAPPLLPTFRRACRYRPEIMPLVYRHLRRLDVAVSDELMACSYELFNGDFLAGGRGEMLIRAT